MPTLDHFSPQGSHRVPHPRSPAAKTFDWSCLSFPHPDSPQARNVDSGSLHPPHPDSPFGRLFRWDPWREEIDGSADEELTQIRLAAEISLEKHSGKLRDTLPDTGLQIVYDRQVSLLQEAYSLSGSLTATDPGQLLTKSQRQITWLHCHLQDALTQSYRLEAGPILAQLDSFQAHTIPGEKEKSLRTIQALAESYYTLATSGVQVRLAEVRKAGKEQEWINTWRARMLACASAGPAGTMEAPPAPPVPSRKSPRKSDSGDDAVKTWIAFQLVDEDGDPVPNVAYKVTLSDKSVMQGVLDDKGIVRFDDINPGECTVSFPEIHAREWKPA